MPPKGTLSLGANLNKIATDFQKMHCMDVQDTAAKHLQLLLLAVVLPIRKKMSRQETPNSVKGVKG